MDKYERTKLKRKARNELKIAFWLLGVFVALLLIIFLTPLVGLFRAPEGTPEWGVVLRVMIPLSFLISMALSALTFSTKSSWTLQKLYEEKRRMKEEQNKFHTKLMWEAIQKKDFEEAKRLYNLDLFITGSMRILCNGILMGIATQTPIDNDWSKGVYERMDSYLK